MALATDCQTPGAQYGCHINQDHIEAWVELPFTLCVNASEAEQLEANIHNALELVLAPYFREDMQAMARLRTTQENVSQLQREIDAVKWHISASDEPTDHDTLKLTELQADFESARWELQNAIDVVRKLVGA